MAAATLVCITRKLANVICIINNPSISILLEKVLLLYRRVATPYLGSCEHTIISDPFRLFEDSSTVRFTFYFYLFSLILLPSGY